MENIFDFIIKNPVKIWKENNKNQWHVNLFQINYYVTMLIEDNKKYYAVCRGHPPIKCHKLLNNHKAYLSTTVCSLKEAKIWIANDFRKLFKASDLSNKYEKSLNWENFSQK